MNGGNAVVHAGARPPVISSILMLMSELHIHPPTLLTSSFTGLADDSHPQGCACLSIHPKVSPRPYVSHLSDLLSRMQTWLSRGSCTLRDRE